MKKILLIAVLCFGALTASAQNFDLHLTPKDTTGVNFDAWGTFEDTTKEQSVICSCNITNGKVSSVFCSRTEIVIEQMGAGFTFKQRDITPSFMMSKGNLFTSDDEFNFSLEVKRKYVELKNKK